ncbi:NaeI family type II restriction endonuclease [Streptomyces lydicus]
MGKLKLQPIGDLCIRNEDGEHLLTAPEDDAEIQEILEWLNPKPVASLYTKAIQASLSYVLDGARTGRYDLLSPDVHPGERASVGAKLEYEVLYTLGLPKKKPLDTKIAGIPVDIKATVGANWAIPREAQCQLCLCTKIEVGKNRHKTWLVRAHRSWLYRGKGNNDGKRGLAVFARDNWSVPLYDWTSIPVNPLKMLSDAQAAEVLSGGTGQEKRVAALFRHLPGVIIPRDVILTVCAGRQDPLRRTRAIKQIAAAEGLEVLCGKWPKDRDRAAALGISLAGNPSAEWIALHAAKAD